MSDTRTAIIAAAVGAVAGYLAGTSGGDGDNRRYSFYPLGAGLVFRGDTKTGELAYCTNVSPCETITETSSATDAGSPADEFAKSRAQMNERYEELRQQDAQK